ncbi:MAG: sulfate adenylyltransferase [Corynebacteriales bacterium]|nr:sulfate adenylyltransferase [Mycobacteriales bacterium]
MTDLLRVATAGSVDDGKSTLIGRLLHDSHNIHLDQLAAISQASRRRGLRDTDLALLTDGLRAEREQGITIDVAYRYFATPTRNIVLADTPGHVQYTRNMVTGASLADVAVVLIDAELGVVEQTRRHIAIAALLGVQHLTLAVNKMDKVRFQEKIFTDIVEQVRMLGDGLDAPEVVAIPVSALHGDNVVRRSTEMPWYQGQTLLEHLESVRITPPIELAARLPIQLVIRGDGYRGYAGRLLAGELSVGAEVTVLPAGVRSTIIGIDTADGALDVARPGQSISVRLGDHVDVARGDVLVARQGGESPMVTAHLSAQVCVVGDRALRVGANVKVRAGTQEVRAVLTDIAARMDLGSLRPESASELCTNDLGQVSVRLAQPIVADKYRACRHTGSFLLLDSDSGGTIAAGMVTEYCQN